MNLYLARVNTNHILRRLHIIIVIPACIFAAYTPVIIADTQDEPEPLAAENFSATFWLTTDYVYRGISSSDEGPAVQASLDWSYSGFYLGVWGSNTRYSDAGIEIDYYGGYNLEWQGLTLDIGALYYDYPGENKYRSDGLDPGNGETADYWETSFSVKHAFEEIFLSTAGVTYFYSPDFFGEDGAGHAIEGNLGLSLPFESGLGIVLGYQDVAGDELSGGYDYIWWQIGIYHEWAGLNFDLSYHDVDDESEACGGDLCDERLVLTLSRTF